MRQEMGASEAEGGVSGCGQGRREGVPAGGAGSRGRGASRGRKESTWGVSGAGTGREKHLQGGRERESSIKKSAGATRSKGASGGGTGSREWECKEMGQKIGMSERQDKK